MPRRPASLLRSLRHACAAVLMGLVALPDPALAASPLPRGQSLDAMSDAELERLVKQINESANWRKSRRPGDPPDFVPGAPVKVMFGAGAAFGRSGGMRGGGAFRRQGLNARRSGLSSRRRGREENTSSLGSSRSRGTSSNRTESSFGGNSRSSSFGNTSNQGAFGEN
ncbi:MAG: hypothetical protein MUF70_10315 [Myxococcota bacterium]|nr:hypothetical protein [Myxococcota bacterium]